MLLWLTFSFIDALFYVHSDWPTIPQLYINGEFIGGCDIITAMHESGELKEVLDEVTEEK